MRTDIHGNEPLCALVPSVSRCFERWPDKALAVVFEIILSIILVPEMVPPHTSKRHSSAPFILL